MTASQGRGDFAITLRPIGLTVFVAVTTMALVERVAALDFARFTGHISGWAAFCQTTQ